MRGLEIGGERSPAYPQYDQVDNVPDFGANIICDAKHLAPVTSDTYDHVFASNVLEHFSWRDTHYVLRSWFRVVKPGGYLEIIVPDVIGILNDYRSGKDEWSHTVERIAGTQDYPGNTHKAFFTYAQLENQVKVALPEATWVTTSLSHAGGGVRACISK